MTSQPYNQPAEIPPELDRWNWGAFLLNWIWGIGNSTFIALLALIPGVGFVVMIVLGLRGSRWAWRNRAWRDAEHFCRSQRKWAIAGLVVWIVVIGGAATAIAKLPGFLKNSEAYRMTMEAVRADSRVAAALGTRLREPYLVYGNLNVGASGGGQASYSIPLTGEKGSGTVYSRAVRKDGTWTLLLIVVRVDGTETPIVIVNKENVRIPDAEMDI